MLHPMRRLAALLLVASLVGVGLADPGVQDIQPLDTGDQRIEALAGTDVEQQVQQIDNSDINGVASVEPPTTASKIASTAGKVAVGVSATAFALGFTFASLMLF
jgi:hypothetical protein